MADLGANGPQAAQSGPANRDSPLTAIYFLFTVIPLTADWQQQQNKNVQIKFNTLNL